MSYTPKIFIRDYGAPTHRLLAYSKALGYGAPAVPMKRDLYLRIVAAEPGEQYLELSGDMQSGSDLLALSGPGNDLLVLDLNDAFRAFRTDAGLIYSILEPALVEAYTLAGQGAALKRGLVLRATSQPLALSGRATIDRRTLFHRASTQSFDLVGVTGNIQLGQIVNIDRGSLALAGRSASLRRGFSIPGNAATYGLSPTSTRLLTAKIIPASASTFTVTRRAADLTKVLVLGLSGDMQSGDDAEKLSGDMQSSDDVLTLSTEGL